MKELDKVNTKKRVYSPSNKGFLSERDSLQKEIKEARSRFGRTLDRKSPFNQKFQKFQKTFSKL
jgi:uncharacterized coiled-coil DUF342 family protein